MSLLSQTMNYTEQEKFPKVERRLKQGTNGQTTAASPTLQYYRPMVTERNSKSRGPADTQAGPPVLTASSWAGC